MMSCFLSLSALMRMTSSELAFRASGLLTLVQVSKMGRAS